jgi:hypothetical protein
MKLPSSSNFNDEKVEDDDEDENDRSQLLCCRYLDWDDSRSSGDADDRILTRPGPLSNRSVSCRDVSSARVRGLHLPGGFRSAISF